MFKINLNKSLFLSKSPKSYFSDFINGNEQRKNLWHGTTILAVKKDKEIVLIGDGQVTYGNMRMKNNGKKIKKLAGTAICGFAGINIFLFLYYL